MHILCLPGPPATGWWSAVKSTDHVQALLCCLRTFAGAGGAASAYVPIWHLGSAWDLVHGGLGVGVEVGQPSVNEGQKSTRKQLSFSIFRGTMLRLFYRVMMGSKCYCIVIAHHIILLINKHIFTGTSWTNPLNKLPAFMFISQSLLQRKSLNTYMLNNSSFFQI